MLNEASGLFWVTGRSTVQQFNYNFRLAIVFAIKFGFEEEE